MQALQVLNTFKQNITGGAFEALAAGTGDALTFFNVPQGSQAYIAAVYGVNTANAAEVAITASRFHDQVRGIRANLIDGDLTAPINRAQLLIPLGFDQRIYPSDVMSVQVNGTALDDTNVVFVLRYADLPGIRARLATPSFVENAMTNLVGIRVVPTTGAGDWGATVALNSTETRLYANTDYAILGWTTSVPIAAIGLTGPDWGNMKIGGPSLAESGHDAYFFANLSRFYNDAYIPIINSNNVGATNIQAANPTGAAAVNIDLLLAQLGTPFSG